MNAVEILPLTQQKLIAQLQKEKGVFFFTDPFPFQGILDSLYVNIWRWNILIS